MFSVVLVWKFLNSWLSKAQQQKLTFDKGRAWMPEVERPEFRKDAKPTERSYGKSVGGFRGIVRFFEEPLLEQLYWYTHENINALSIRKLF